VFQVPATSPPAKSRMDMIIHLHALHIITEFQYHSVQYPLAFSKFPSLCNMHPLHQGIACHHICSAQGRSALLEPHQPAIHPPGAKSAIPGFHYDFRANASTLALVETTYDVRADRGHETKSEDIKAKNR